MMLLERTSFVDRQKFQLHADTCNCEHHWQTEHTKRSMHVLPSQDLITGFRHTHKIMLHTWYCNAFTCSKLMSACCTHTCTCTVVSTVFVHARV